MWGDGPDRLNSARVIYFMKVYKSINEDRSIEINYCKDGLYIEINVDNQDYLNIIIPHDDLDDLIKYLRDYGKETN